MSFIEYLRYPIMFETKIANDKLETTIKFCNEILEKFLANKENNKNWQDVDNSNIKLLEDEVKLLNIARDKINNTSVDIKKIDVDFVCGEFLEQLEELLRERKTSISKKDFQCYAEKQQSINKVRIELGLKYSELEINVMKSGLQTLYKSQELKRQIKDSLDILKSIVEGQNFGKEKQKTLTKELGFLAFHIVLSAVVPVVGCAMKDAIKALVEKTLTGFPNTVPPTVADALISLQAGVTNTTEISVEEGTSIIDNVAKIMELIIERTALEGEIEIHSKAEESEEKKIEKIAAGIEQEKLQGLLNSRDEIVGELAQGTNNVDKLLNQMLAFSDLCIDVALQTTVKRSTLNNKVEKDIAEYRKKLDKVSGITNLETTEKNFLQGKKKEIDKLLEDIRDTLSLKDITSLTKDPNSVRTLGLKTVTNWMTLVNAEKDEIVEGVSAGQPLAVKISPMGKETFMKFYLTPNGDPEHNIYYVRHLFGNQAKMKFVEALPELQLLPAFRSKKDLIKISQVPTFGSFVNPVARQLHTDEINDVNYRNQRHMTWISLKQIFDAIKKNDGNMFFQFKKSNVAEATNALRSIIQNDIIMRSEIDEYHPLYSKNKPHVLGPLYLAFVLPQFSELVNTPEFLESLVQKCIPKELEHFHKIAEMVKKDYQMPATKEHHQFFSWAVSEISAHKEVMKAVEKQQSANMDLEDFKLSVQVEDLNELRYEAVLLSSLANENPNNAEVGKIYVAAKTGIYYVRDLHGVVQSGQLTNLPTELDLTQNLHLTDVQNAIVFNAAGAGHIPAFKPKRKEERSATSIKEKYHVSANTMENVVRNYQKRHKLAVRIEKNNKIMARTSEKLQNDVENQVGDIQLLPQLQIKYKNSKLNFEDKLSFAEIKDPSATLAEFIRELAQKENLPKQLRAIKRNQTISYANKIELLNHVKNIDQKFINMIKKNLIHSVNPAEIFEELSFSKNTEIKVLKEIETSINSLRDSLRKQKNPSIALLSQLFEINAWLIEIKDSPVKINAFMRNVAYDELASLMDHSKIDQGGLGAIRKSTMEAVKNHLDLLNKNLEDKEGLPEQTLKEVLQEQNTKQVKKMKEIFVEHLGEILQLLSKRKDPRMNEMKKHVKELKDKINTISEPETLSQMVKDINTIHKTLRKDDNARSQTHVKSKDKESSEKHKSLSISS
jgi:hypothetical protein